MDCAVTSSPGSPPFEDFTHPVSFIVKSSPHFLLILVNEVLSHFDEFNVFENDLQLNMQLFHISCIISLIFNCLLKLSKLSHVIVIVSLSHFDLHCIKFLILLICKVVFSLVFIHFQ